MPAPTVTVLNPPPNNYSDDNLRPQALVKWTSGTGPFDVTHEWDTDINFGSPIQDVNTSATSPDAGVPPSDMGPSGTTWYYRVTVEDTSDTTSTTSSIHTLDWSDAIDHRRYLYLLADVGVAFQPIDINAAGPADDAFPADGAAIDFRRYLYLLGNVGVGIDPIDAPAGGWDQGGGGSPGDGSAIDFRRYFWLLADVGVGFDPIDTPAGGWNPEAIPGPGEPDAGDGYAIDFRRYLYQLAAVVTDTPTPHIWYVFPTFGREGWEFKIIGYGFGDTQATYSGSATLNGVALSILTWELIAESDPALTIDPVADIAEPIHQQIRTSVPIGGTSGLVIVCTDAP